MFSRSSKGTVVTAPRGGHHGRHGGRLWPWRGPRAGGRSLDGHARLRCPCPGAGERSEGEGRGNGDEPAAAQRRRSPPSTAVALWRASTGCRAAEAGGDPLDWFYYVNGIEASKGAAATNVHSGDHVWWDLHDWSQTDDVPAVVGSFPEPFLNGVEANDCPCAWNVRSAKHPCRAVIARLRGSVSLPPSRRSAAEPSRTRCRWLSGNGRGYTATRAYEHRTRTAHERRVRALRSERPDADAARQWGR